VRTIPFTSSDIDEASKKPGSRTLIKETHEYLLKSGVADKVKPETFFAGPQCDIDLQIPANLPFWAARPRLSARLTSNWRLDSMTHRATCLSWRGTSRQAPFGPTKPVSSIHCMGLSPTSRITPVKLQSCAATTVHRFSTTKEDPRKCCEKPDGNYIMTACVWGGQYFDDGVNFHTAGHQVAHTLSPTFKVLYEEHPVYGYNGVHPFANLVHEKNWLPFLYDDKLHFIYHVTPHKVFHIVNEYETQTYASDGVTDWSYGRPSGGTAPIPFDDDTWIVLFHSFTEEGVIRTYHVGA
jgi:hypothetical protein